MKRGLQMTALAVMMVMGGCASRPTVEVASGGDPAIPSDLRPGQDSSVLMKLRAEGAQLYVCQASRGATGAFGWVLRAPDARLYDQAGRLTATHFAGPTWQSTIDGSAVRGQKVKDEPAPVPGAIPWLLLKTVATTGHGQFSSVVAISRVATEGGSPPVEACSATNQGAERAAPYRAEYVFYGAGKPVKEAERSGW